MTAIPNLSSLSSTVCPPRRAAFASRSAVAPPLRIEVRISWGTFFGKQHRLSANNGRPPIAQTSEIELAAATRPNRAGSSQTGVMKSTVATSEVSSRRNTPASSPVSAPTRILSSAPASASSGATIFRRSSGPVLAAQPPEEAQPVSRKSLLNQPMPSSYPAEGNSSPSSCRQASHSRSGAKSATSPAQRSRISS